MQLVKPNVKKLFESRALGQITGSGAVLGRRRRRQAGFLSPCLKGALFCMLNGLRLFLQQKF